MTQKILVILFFASALAAEASSVCTKLEENPLKTNGKIEKTTCNSESVRTDQAPCGSTSNGSNKGCKPKTQPVPAQNVVR